MKQAMESSLLLIVERDLGKISSEDKTLKTGQKTQIRVPGLFFTVSWEREGI